MRSKLWILLVCFHCLALTAVAQSPAKRQLVLPIATGGFVAFRSETSGAAKGQMKDNQLSALLFAQAIAGENRVIHRVLTDAASRVVLAYDLAIESDPGTQKFNLAVLPSDAAIRRYSLQTS